MDGHGSHGSFLKVSWTFMEVSLNIHGSFMDVYGSFTDVSSTSMKDHGYSIKLS